MNPRRRAADGPLATLLLLAAVFVAALAVFLLRHVVGPDPFSRCDSVLASLRANASALGWLGLLVPAALLAQVLVATALALGHQLWATRRVLASVLAGRVEPGPRLRRLAAAAGLGGDVDLVRSDTAFTFCHGLRRPRVCLSTALAELLTDEELLAVLRHEAHHRRHRDPLKILTSRALASGLFFLPLAGALHDAYLAAKELCADAEAVPDGDDWPLASALVKLVRARRPIWPAGVLALGSFSPTEARLQRLLAPGGKARFGPTAADWLVSLALVALIFGVSGTALAADELPPARAECRVAAGLGLPPPVPVTSTAPLPRTTPE